MDPVDLLSNLPLLGPGDPGCAYVEHAPGTMAQPLAPSFLLGSVGPSVLRMYFAAQQLTSVGCYALEGVSVTSHGVLLRDGRPLQCAQLNLDAGSIGSTRKHGELLVGVLPTRTIPGEVVNLIGPGVTVYGHWLVDFLPKLYLLHLSGHDPRRQRYLLPEGLPRFGLEWLKLLDIGDEQIVWYAPHSEVVLPERLIAPTLLRTNSAAHACLAGAADYLATLLPPVARRRLPRRLFLSRARAEADWREMENRAEIEHMAGQAGYHVLSPELLPLLEQFQLFRSARFLIGEYGSALHASVFAGKKLVVCNLRAAAFHPGFLQSGICAAKGQRVGYVFAPSAEDAVDQRFAPDIQDFSSALQRLATM